LRRYNGGVIDPPTFRTAITALQAEVVTSVDFNLLPISDATVFASVAMVRKHNLNATDATILTTWLNYVQSSGVTGCVLVASDKRLLRAADNEGLKTLNPETLPVADVPAFLTAL
jgi:predicted nucleic acid-binding protein